MTENIKTATREALRRLDSTIRSADAYSAQMGNLNPTDMALIRVVYNGEGSTPSEVSRILGCTKPAVSTACDRLEACGFLRRNTGATDRRQVDLALTQIGAEIAADDAEHVSQAIDKACADFSADELTTIARFLVLAQVHVDGARVKLIGKCAAMNEEHAQESVAAGRTRRPRRRSTTRTLVAA